MNSGNRFIRGEPLLNADGKPPGGLACGSFGLSRGSILLSPPSLLTFLPLLSYESPSVNTKFISYAIAGTGTARCSHVKPWGISPPRPSLSQMVEWPQRTTRERCEGCVSKGHSVKMVRVAHLWSARARLKHKVEELVPPAVEAAHDAHLLCVRQRGPALLKVAAHHAVSGEHAAYGRRGRRPHQQIVCVATHPRRVKKELSVCVYIRDRLILHGPRQAWNPRGWVEDT